MTNVLVATIEKSLIILLVNKSKAVMNAVVLYVLSVFLFFVPQGVTNTCDFSQTFKIKIAFMYLDLCFQLNTVCL